MAPKWQPRHPMPYRLAEFRGEAQAEKINFSETSRTAILASKLHKMHRVTAQKATVAASCLTAFEWRWGLFVASDELNPHWHTSLLKRYMRSLIQLAGYDAYAYAGQAWLDHPSDGPAVLVGALSTGYLNQNFKALTKLGLPILAVVEDYTEGHHADTEYLYTCVNGLVTGRSNGKEGVWYDENLFSEYRDGPVGDGWFVHTLASLGPQRLVVFDTYETTNAVTNKPMLLQVDPAMGVVNRRSCPQHLDLEIPTTPILSEHPGYAPKAYKRVARVPWRQWLKSACAVSLLLLLSTTPLLWWGAYALPFVGTWLVRVWLASLATSGLTGYLIWRYAWSLDNVDQCPEYYLVDSDCKDFLSWIRGIHAFSHKGFSLPPGFYHIDESRIARVCPSHPDCNYTNMVAIAEQYCASKSWNPKTGVRKLIRLFGPINERFFTASSSDIFVKEPELPPDLVRTIPIPVKINPQEPKIRIASLDFNHEDFTLPVPSAESIAATATTRVFQRIDEAPCLARLETFWRDVVRGGYILANPTPPDFSNYAGSKRRLYEATYNKMCDGKVAHYTSFLKIEVLPSASLHAGKAARAIEPNSKSFNVSCFNFFHAFEKTLLETRDQHGLRLFAKGCNMDARCEEIQRKMQHYTYVWSCDFKNFDGHHKGKAYQDEIDFYLKIGLDRFYGPGLKESRLDGLYDAAQPKRHSGDLFTGSGNCLIVGSMLYWAGCEHSIYCDGDDTLVFSNNPNCLTELSARACKAGHVLTFEEVKHGDLGLQVPFCQHVFCGDHYWPSHKRICNKLFNIPYTTTQDLENRIYGKLCAVAAYTKAGILHLPHFECKIDEDIAWRYETVNHMIAEPSPDPEPAGAILALLNTLHEKCPPRQGSGLGQVLTRADLVVKRAVKEFVNSNPAFREQESKGESFGTRFLRWVTPVSRSRIFNSQFGSASFVDCTKHTNSMTSNSSSSLPTTLSPMVYSPSHSTTTPAKDHQVTPKSCSNKSDQGKKGSTKQSKSTFQKKSSAPPRREGTQLAQAATFSTGTSGSPQVIPSNQSPSTSNTTRPSTPRKQQNRNKGQPPLTSTTTVRAPQPDLLSHRAPTSTASTSDQVTKSLSPERSHQAQKVRSAGGTDTISNPPVPSKGKRSTQSTDSHGTAALTRDNYPPSGDLWVASSTSSPPPPPARTRDHSGSGSGTPSRGRSSSH